MKMFTQILPFVRALSLSLPLSLILCSQNVVCKLAIVKIHTQFDTFNYSQYCCCRNELLTMKATRMRFSLV